MEEAINEKISDKRKLDIRIAEKPVITIEEAAALFSIGEGKIRAMISNDPYAEWLLKVGTWTRIKRKPFEEMILNTYSI